MRVRFIVLTTALIAIVSMSCGKERGVPGPYLSASSDSYAPGDQVTVEIRNGGAVDVGYNICYAFLTLERQVADAWEQLQVGLGPEPQAPCTTQLDLLAPGARDEATAYLPHDLGPGTYRIATGVEIGPELAVLETEPFEVRG